MSDTGLFGPGTVTWRVNREGVLLVGGGAALVLQVAHPLVAAGVAAHPNYPEDPWGRVSRTRGPTTKMALGSPGAAGAAGGGGRAAARRAPAAAATAASRARAAVGGEPAARVRRLARRPLGDPARAPARDARVPARAQRRPARPRPGRGGVTNGARRRALR